MRHPNRSHQRRARIQIARVVKIERVPHKVGPPVRVKRPRRCPAKHVRPLIHPVPIHIYVLRKLIRWEEVSLHLPVLINVDLRVPLQKHRHFLPGLILRERNPVAIHVESIVIGTTVKRARQGPVVSRRIGASIRDRVIGHHVPLVPIRVINRIQDHHRIVQSRPQATLLRRCQVVKDGHSGLERSRLVSVNALVHPHNRGRPLQDRRQVLPRRRVSQRLVVLSNLL